MSTLHITTLQADLVWENKEANLRYFEDQIINHVGQTELIVLPEMFTTGFTMRPELFAEPMDGETVAWMRDTARKKRAIVTGSFIASEGGNYYNRLVWMQPDGHFGCYDKRHLFTLAGEEKHYTAGNKKTDCFGEGLEDQPADLLRFALSRMGAAIARIRRVGCSPLRPALVCGQLARTQKPRLENIADRPCHRKSMFRCGRQPGGQ